MRRDGVTVDNGWIEKPITQLVVAVIASSQPITSIDPSSLRHWAPPSLLFARDMKFPAASISHVQRHCFLIGTASEGNCPFPSLMSLWHVPALRNIPRKTLFLSVYLEKKVMKNLSVKNCSLCKIIKTSSNAIKLYALRFFNNYWYRLVFFFFYIVQCYWCVWGHMTRSGQAKSGDLWSSKGGDKTLCGMN